ncbi:MAG: ABC-2 family transporter protein [Archangium sp.]
MSIAATFRAFPTLFRVSFAEAVAYRAEMFVWVFSTTMPLIMLMLWTTVTTVAPVEGRGGHVWSADDFSAYFLSVFIVRQLISAWASWEINFEVRRGNLAMRLLRPMHPVIGYAVGNLAYLPLRTIVTLPVVAILIATQGGKLPTDWRIWALWCVAMFGSWLINFFVNVAVGALSFYLESSLKLMEVWLALFFVSAGYLFPLEVVKVQWVRTLIDVLPFRYIISLPAELMTGRLSIDEAWRAIGIQYAWGVGAFVVSLIIWSRGVKRFQSFGG